MKALQEIFNRMSSDKLAPEKNYPVQNYITVTFNYLIITLSKYIELYDKHNPVIYRITGSDLPKKIYKELKTLKIRDLRNRFAAHAFDKKTKKPITPELYSEYLNKIETEHGSLVAFYTKIHTYPFVENMPLIDALKKIKDELIKYLDSNLESINS